MTEINVTVVVCTYNRAEMLRTAIDSLLALRTGGRFQYEIVVVDNGSTDNTASILEELGRRAAVPLRAVREPRAGVACARNAGIRAAQGQWIAFFDDDQVAEPDWLYELFKVAQTKRTRFVGGAVRLLLTNAELRCLPPLCRKLLGESATVSAPRKLDRKVFAGTGNLLLDRTLFDEVGLFDESLRAAGEDTDLNRRIRAAGIEGWFAPSAVVRHMVPEYRLREDYFRWTSLRNGMHVANRDRRQWGRMLFPMIVAARFGQAVACYVPLWLWGCALRSPQTRLHGRCQLWRAEGYVRLALAWAAPSWLAQRDFISQVSFRTERELFAQRQGAA